MSARIGHVVAKILVVGVLCVVAALAVAWRAGALEPAVTWWHRAAPEKPTVLFIVLDTVRSDHLSLCGYGRPTSPTLQRLAKRSDGWTCDAYAPGSWTLPSHASFFTGRSVPEHGAHFAARGEIVRGMTIRPLPASFETLAEILRRRGYQALGVSGNPVLVPASGLTQGFGGWDAAWGFGPYYGDALVARVRRMLRRADSGLPLFLFVNIADAHDPWAGVPEGVGWVAPRTDGLHYFASDEPGEWEGYVTGSMSEAEADSFRRRITDLYDYALFRADRTLSAVLDEVERHGWADAGLRLVITSDHGEFLGEKNLARHGRYLWEPNNRVPLLVMGTGASVKLEQRVAAIDVFGLVLEGRLPSTPTLASAVAFPDSLWFRRSRGRVGGQLSAAVWQGDDKWIWADGTVSRYDLRTDPDEDRPVPVDAKTEAPAALMDLAAQATRSKARGDATADPKLLERLRSLGYVD
jgi:arylsulfatase A-like enzyme